MENEAPVQKTLQGTAASSLPKNETPWVEKPRKKLVVMDKRSRHNRAATIEP